MIINYFFLIPYFYAIILSNYSKIRERLQLTTQAISEILTDESKAISMKWINLIFCIAPKSEAEILNEKIKLKLRQK